MTERPTSQTASEEVAKPKEEVIIDKKDGAAEEEKVNIAPEEEEIQTAQKEEEH